MPDPAKIHAIAEAELTCHRFAVAGTARKSISGAVQKAVLWVLWYHEGQRLSLEAIAARAGTSMGSTSRAIAALRSQTIITVTKDLTNLPCALPPSDLRRTHRRAPRAYRVNTATLTRKRSTHALVGAAA